MLANPELFYGRIENDRFTKCVDTLLRSGDYPPLLDEYGSFNEVNWALENTPRFIFSLRRFGLVLDQLYLIRRYDGLIVNVHYIASGDPRIV